MALPSTPPIKLSDLATEYGVAAPYKLTDFLGKPGAPTAVPIKITDFLGLSNNPIVIPATLTVAAFEIGPAYASFTMNADGTYTSNDGDTNATGNWHSSGPNAPGSNYECMATIVSGSVSGTLNTWLNLGTNRLWSNLCTPPNGGVCSASGKIRIDIREVGTTTILGTSEVTINAFGDLS